jgi:DNA-binding CsgD family transcriptional regulator
MNRVTPQQTLQALTPAATEPAFIALLADLAADADANPRSAAVLETLRGHQSMWQEINRISPAGSSDGIRPGYREPDRITRTLSRPATSIPAQPSRYAVLDGIPIKLTAREADVLGQLALGSSYTEIARDLFITENSVKTHLASLYRKLAVDKRSAALRVARNLGLLT